MKFATLTKAIPLATIITLASLPGEAQNLRNSQLTQIPLQKSINTSQPTSTPNKTSQPTPTPTNTSQPNSNQTNSNQTFWNALISAIALATGAGITALASAYSSRQKIKEIEITYIQRLRENYLANARLYTDTVYIPISIALSKLSEQYLQFRNQIDFKTQTADDQAAEVFHQACHASYTS